MVDQATKAKQFEGFDFNDYVEIQTALIPAGTRWFYPAGATTNASALGVFMLTVPNPTPGGPLTDIGPQYPWPYHGQGPFPAAALPLTVSEVQKTLFRVINNDINVYFFDLRLAQALFAWFIQNPAPAALPPGPALGNWPMPGPVLLEAAVGLYEFERKWVWLFYEATVAGADGNLHVYMEG